jgi:predicted NBD/HSP70 family sugar kinase
MKPTNFKSMKQHNIRLVIQALYDVDEISRIDLARYTTLNKATITGMINELIDLDLVVELDKKVKTSGRSANLIALNDKAGYILSLDLQPHKIYGTLSSLRGTIVYEYTHPVSNSHLEFYLPELYKTIDFLLEQTPVSTYGILGIGVGVYGILSHDKRVIFAPLSSWKDVELRSIIEDYTSIETYVENEANISALGEQILTNTMKNLITLDISSGVGSGIILEGNLYTGHDGYAGEIGHTIVEPGGLLCKCGNQGCLEQYISETALTKAYFSLTSSEITFDELVLKMQQRDHAAQEVYQQFIQYLSIGINNISVTLNPEGIIIRSRLINARPETISLIKNNLRSQVLSLHSFTSSNEKNAVNTLGTSFVLLQRFLDKLYER